MSLHDKIPNNVDLSSNRKLQKALEAWQPSFLDWWMEMGPDGFQQDQIYLRTAISVEPDGWAHFDYVKMPDYRWGIFLTPREGERLIPSGDHEGKPAWQEVPGEMRKDLRRIIVTQGDTEPASVEQQRQLGKSCPSLYDLRNLFQVNVEEGRHLWAMVHILHEFFGRDGREEAEEMLERRSGNQDSPRILAAFNKPIDDWLSFFCFTMFTDRDGKFQLAALAEGGFDPLARATQFMLTEEAHHLFVGEMGIRRIVHRTCELMKEAPEGDVTRVGGIPLDLLQKYINYWYSASIDLFGGEDSSNAATYFGHSLKGRFKESRDKNITDHMALDGVHLVERPTANGVTREEIPLRRAMNLILREAYTDDCARAMRNWNKTIAAAGINYELKLPTHHFNREVGLSSGIHFDTAGNVLTDAQWQARVSELLPTDEDRVYVQSLMQQVLEPGKFAQWIAPPGKGINDRPQDHKYVLFSDDPEYAERA